MRWRKRPRGTSFSRRRLLIGLGAGGLALGAGAVFGRRRLRIRRPRLDRDLGTEPLSGQELAVLVALAEVLVPTRYWTGRDTVTALIEEAARSTPGLWYAYHEGVILLNERTGARFASMSVDARDSVLSALLWRYSAEASSTTSGMLAPGQTPGSRRGIERAWLGERRRRFRELVMSDLLERLYLAATPCILGYENTVGVPGGAFNYVDPPEAATRSCGEAGRGSG